MGELFLGMAKIKLELYGSAIFQLDRQHLISFSFGKGISTRKVDVELPPEWNYTAEQPILVDFGPPNTYLYRNRLVNVVKGIEMNQDEFKLRIKHFVLKQEKDFKKITREVEVFENFEKAVSARREKIPDDVRMFVWQRDQGKCIKYDSSERLEFNHVIPVSKGGC